jgi:capsular polysaccharide biosynthesis protein
MEEKTSNVIDLREVAKLLVCKKKLFLKVWVITFILACAWILPVPRTYQTTVKLAPEMDSSSGGTLSTLASSFGFDLGDLESTDAISPALYPDLFKSNSFIVSLFSIQVENEAGDIKTNYYTYLRNHQKVTFYKIPFIWLKRTIKGLFPKKELKNGNDSGGGINPFLLSERDYLLVEGVKNLISCVVDKKTGVITITVEDQDRIICAMLADSVSLRLQNFITEYRTNKARVDVSYYENLTESSLKEYKASVAAYSQYCDNNRNSILQSYLSKRDELENDVQLKLQTYTAMNTQLQNAKAKLQERIPAFTVLDGASAPIKPSKPKRMIFVLAMLVLSSMVTSVVVLRKYLLTFL